jgi:hypothetical protein
VGPWVEFPSFKLFTDVNVVSWCRDCSVWMEEYLKPLTFCSVFPGEDCLAKLPQNKNSEKEKEVYSFRLYTL